MKTLGTGILLASMAVLMGILGALTSPHARATVGYGVAVNPGGPSNALNCGWHSTCIDPWPSGNALDWSSTDDASIYWRSWATSDAGSGTMAYGYPGNASGSCYATKVDIYSLGWAWKGSAAYLHTVDTSADSFWIDGSWSGAYTSEGPIGETVDPELTDECPWEGAHLHQFSTASGWYANTGVFPAAPSTGTGYSLTSQANWQNRTNWDE